MKTKQLFWISIGLICLFATSCKQQTQSEPEPVLVIFDTDMGPDYDDVGALAILHAFADKGEAKILATISSNKYTNSVPCIEIINRYFGRPDIPLGAPRNGVDMIDPRFERIYWPEILPLLYFHETKRSEDAPDAVSVYRKILSNQPDSSVHIITVGFLTNLAALLQSPPDEFSDLDGTALVKQKVKRLISMAGRFPQGQEFNVCTDNDASILVFGQWPTPITLSGFETGVEIITGKRLTTSDDIANSPVKDAFSMGMTIDVDGRCSWDQTAVLVGVRGCGDYFDTVKGRMLVAPNCESTWEDDPDGTHELLVWKMPKEELTRIIEDLMMHQPKK
ncbi:MAG: nucleoside hydrolase [Dysgonamonadaceae bacterium]|jgi:inosine-uridine nucleoside N-ribohydrolase|nr:nucleoside hydrolase [Dysgonamonadaceae bacterium]